MTRKAVAKFKPGDKVRVVKSGWGISSKDMGKITTIICRGYDYYSGSEGYIAQYDVDVSVLDDTTGGKNVTEWSFELVEDKPVVEQPADLITITWQGATITFDPSIAAGEKMVQSIVAMIYKEAA